MVGVAVERLAVGKCKLAGFQHGVSVLKRVVSHRLQVEVFEHVKDLQRHDALRPGGVAAYLVTHKGGLDWLAVFRFVVGEVVLVQNTADLPGVCRDALRNVALVEGVVSGADAVDAATDRCVLRRDHLLQHVGEVLLHQQRAGLRDIAVLEEDIPAAWGEQVELLACSRAV